MSSVLTISPDDTGSLLQHSTLFEDAEFALNWRVLQPGELQLYQGNEEYPEPLFNNDWSVFRYRADWKIYDVGAEPILVNDSIEEGGGLFPKPECCINLAVLHQHWIGYGGR